MLSQFNEPPIVVCVLCRGSVSVRKGDRSRFYNHISQDHEVHYDLELFFTLSYLEEQEKGNFITVMNQKIDNSSSETMFVSRQTNQEPERQILYQLKLCIIIAFILNFFILFFVVRESESNSN